MRRQSEPYSSHLPGTFVPMMPRQGTHNLVQIIIIGNTQLYTRLNYINAQARPCHSVNVLVIIVTDNHRLLILHKTAGTYRPTKLFSLHLVREEGGLRSTRNLHVLGIIYTNSIKVAV